MSSFVRRRVWLWLSACIVALATGWSAAWAGYTEGIDALAARDWVRARAEFERDRGNPKSLFELARMARFGWGEPRNDVRATHLFREAGELGHLEGRLEYAYSLLNGRGVATDIAAGVPLLQSLADAGVTHAMVSLGRAAMSGWWGLPRDDARAAAWFQRASDAGDDDGRVMLSHVHLHGRGVPKNEAQGTALLLPAVQRGHVDAQIEYAMLLSQGVGVARDEAAAAELYRKLAVADNRVAQYGLGMALLQGRGAPRDERGATRLIDAAARQGWPWAQLQLADMYRTGQGVPQIKTEAYRWYSIAARSQVVTAADQANAQRAALARELPEQQVSRLSAQAAAFAEQTGFKPRAVPLPEPSRTDRIELGGASLRVPLPPGYQNAWQTVAWMQSAFPNDPALRPLLLAYGAQEDGDRVRLGLGARVRSIEVSRHLADDAVKITPTLFADVKAQLRAQSAAGVAEGRFRNEGVLRDDEQVWCVLRASNTEPDELDAQAFVLVKDKVLALSFSGFKAAQKAELTELARISVDATLAANRPGLFSR